VTTVFAPTGLASPPRRGAAGPVWRERALPAPARGGGAAGVSLAQILRAAHPVVARRNAVWALARIDTAAARAALRDATRDP